MMQTLRRWWCSDHCYIIKFPSICIDFCIDGSPRSARVICHADTQVFNCSHRPGLWWGVKPMSLMEYADGGPINKSLSLEPSPKRVFPSRSDLSSHHFILPEQSEPLFAHFLLELTCLLPGQYSWFFVKSAQTVRAFLLANATAAI